MNMANGFVNIMFMRIYYLKDQMIHMVQEVADQEEMVEVMEAAI